MKMKIVETFKADIYLGLREGYDGKVHDIEEVYEVLQEHCNTVGDGVTVTPTTFIYTDGNEPGCIIGWIKYPRFIKSNEEIKILTLNVAKTVMQHFNQYRVSIVTSDYTYMLETDLIHE